MSRRRGATGGRGRPPGGRGGDSRPGSRDAAGGKGSSSRSSGRWLARQRKDRFVRDAQAAGYRSRAAFKLEEIDRRLRLLRPGARVLDLGAAPGGWTQVAVQAVGPRGRVVAVDLLPMQAVPGAVVLQGDFADPQVLAQLAAMAGAPVDLVMSDMAPNLSGIRDADQARHLELLDLALAACRELLRPGGDLLVKAFNGAGQEDWLRRARSTFATLRVVKPEASRAESREVYVVGRGHRPERHAEPA